MFHCGNLKLSNNNLFYLQRENKICGFCHPELVSGSLTECIEESPLLEERDWVRCLTEQEQSEILRSSSTEVLQSDCLSLRMTNAFDNHNKCGHPEQSEGSLTERTGQFPSPREEGLGEMVLPIAKVEILKHIIKKCAFTLAEVLITLGIIGVVAAITIPSLVTNYQKHVVETKLAKFNSTMNQAVRLSMVDNGDPDGWVEQSREYTYADMVDFMNTYFLPYMKYVKMERNTSNYNNGVRVILLDGSMFTFDIDLNGGDIVYYVNGKTEINPRNKFQYQFTKRVHWSSADKMNSVSYIEPYILNWNGTVDHLKTGAIWACKKGCTNCGYCTKLIQLNGWKIPKDYPW